jgi:hypothetical protein
LSHGCPLGLGANKLRLRGARARILCGLVCKGKPDSLLNHSARKAWGPTFESDSLWFIFIAVQTHGKLSEIICNLIPKIKKIIQSVSTSGLPAVPRVRAGYTHGGRRVRRVDGYGGHG